MGTGTIYLVHLRRPGADDVRADPFYEFGSFGCTKCHEKNLMHPRHARELVGARLGFVQGGPLGSRLVYVTPPISVKVWRHNCEAKWKPSEMPFKYSDAPLLIRNDRESDFQPVINKLVAKGAPGRRSWESGLSSLFRSCVTPLPQYVAKEVIRVYERQRRKRSAIASEYHEALPRVTAIDSDRSRTYRAWIQELRSEADGIEGKVLAIVNGEIRTRTGCGSGRRSNSRPRKRRCR